PEDNIHSRNRRLPVSLVQIEARLCSPVQPSHPATPPISAILRRASRQSLQRAGTPGANPQTPPQPGSPVAAGSKAISQGSPGPKPRLAKPAVGFAPLRPTSTPLPPARSPPFPPAPRALPDSNCA